MVFFLGTLIAGISFGVGWTFSRMYHTNVQIIRVVYVPEDEEETRQAYETWYKNNEQKLRGPVLRIEAHQSSILDRTH